MFYFKMAKNFNYKSPRVKLVEYFINEINEILKFNLSYIVPRTQKVSISYMLARVKTFMLKILIWKKIFANPLLLL
jgi:hypothetical protein